MPTIKVNNLQEFKKVWEKAPQLRPQLTKAFPHYVAQLTGDYLDTLYGKGKQTASEAVSKVKETVGNIQQKKTPIIKQAAEAVKSGAKKVTPILKGGSKFIAPAIAIPSAVQAIKDPNATTTSKALDVASAAASFVPAVGVPASIATAIGSNLIRNSAEDSYKRSEQDFLNWQAQGLDPTYFNQDTIDRYNQYVLNQNPSEQLNQQKQELNNLNESYWNQAEQRLENYIPRAIQNIESVPQPNNKILNPSPLQSKSTGVKSNLGITNQNNTQPILNQLRGTSDLTYPVNVDSTSLLPNMIRQSNNINLEQLKTQPSRMNTMPQTNLNDYASLIGAMERENNLQSSQLLQNYLNALEADRKQNALNQFTNNMINQMVNASPRVTAGYVSSKGNYIEPSYVNRNYNEQFLQPTPKETNYNEQIAKLQMEVAMNQQADRMKYLQNIQNLESAQALGNQLGVDPALFMNQDNAQAYLQYIANPKVVGEERRTDIYPQTLADMLKARDELAGSIDLANINNSADIQRALINAQAMRDQAYVAGMLGLQRQNISDMNANYRAKLAESNEAYLKMMGYQNAKDVANIYAQNNIDLAKYKGAMGDTPTDKVKAFASLLGNSRNPAEAQAYYNMIMGVTPMQTPVTTGGNELSPQQWQTWLNLK